MCMIVHMYGPMGTVTQFERLSVRERLPLLVSGVILSFLYTLLVWMTREAIFMAFIECSSALSQKMPRVF